MKKLVITGGCGHIGSYLLRSPSILNYDVTIIDSLLTDRIYSLFNTTGKVKFIKKDICTDDLRPDLENTDYVIHLAGLVNAADTVDKDNFTRQVNLDGSKKVSEAANETGVKKIIYASSASVYGPTENTQPRTELDEQLNPQTPYARYKLEAEQYFKNHYSLRLGTIFGYSPGMRFHTVTNKFLWCAATNQPITIWKPGIGKRPYLSLYDVAHAIFTILGQDIVPGIYNIVTEHWSPIQIVNILTEYYPKLNIEWVIPRILNQDAYILDTNKAERVGLLDKLQDSSTSLREYFDYMSNVVWKNLDTKK